MSKMEFNVDSFALKFEFMCKCGNSHKRKFIIGNEKSAKTLLCSYCERKYDFKMNIREIK